jgi:hypothetical protein
MLPVIHGKGRIIFKRLDIVELRLWKIKPIPGGPEVNGDFVGEGVRILEMYPEHDLPYITVVPDYDEGGTFWGEYWLIEGRHRWASYKIARPNVILPCLLGHGMKVLDIV